MTGYPAPDDDPDDDEIGQRFLEDLRAELANTLDDYGRTEWRKARNRQILRLRSYGWTHRDLAAHYAMSPTSIAGILAKQGVPNTEWTITLTGAPADLAAVRDLLDDRGIRHTITSA